MIHAINQHGRESWFTERVWNKLPKHKNGWIEFDSKEMGEVLIPQQIIEFQAQKKDLVAVEEKEPEKVVKPRGRKPKKQVK